jgi:tRNA A58 N-methylase Trm61
MTLNNILIIIFLFVFVLLTVLVLASMARAYFSAAPWCPTKKKDWDRVIKAGGIKKGDIVYDFGSGTGCVASYVGKKTGAIVIGIELSLPFYLWSKVRNIFFGARNVKMQNGDFFKRDIGDVDCIFCFLTPKAMNRLGEKFKKELKTGAKVISYVFKIPDWNPIAVDCEGGSGSSIYVYQK